MPLLNPPFLLAVAAMGVPLWLHLSRRRKYQKIEIGTLRFLHQTLRERRKKSRIEEIVLLLLRMSAVGLLAVVFARPFWPRAEKAAEKEAETIILLDASGSITPGMAETARKAAARVISTAGGGKIKIAQFSDEVQPLDSLAAYRPIAGAPTRVGAALGWALDHFILEGGNAGKVVLISHLAAEGLPSQPPRVWPPQMAVELVALKPPSVDNAAVRRLSLLTPYGAEAMEIEALVWMPPGRTSEEDRTVTLEAEGLHETAVVPPGSERVVFRFHPPQAEVHGRVSVTGGDPWPADDQRPFAVHWTEPARVLLVDGQPGSTPFEGEAYFIEKALAASGAAHGKSAFKPEIIFALDGRNGPVDLTGVRAIALCGVTDCSPASARLLADFVARGGGLISVLNDKWTPSAAAALVEAGLFPESIAQTGAEEKRPLVSWDREHPALSLFDGRDGGDLRELPWRDGFGAQAGAGWRALATLDGGHALFLEKEKRDRAAGPVAVCFHPLNRQWSDIPREPLFVPLMKSLFTALGRVEPAAPEARVVSPGARELRPIGCHVVGGVMEVVAPDAGEGLVASASEGAFRAAFGLPTADAIPPALPAPEQAAERTRPGEFWPWLLIGLLLLLALENIVATRNITVPSP
ncbi:MAG: hypothetical protein JWL90_2565 [Chthoniobacteraceae bacterium]|nr:hypothetical protein [Chthoniobacteraceae bacterium]